MADDGPVSCSADADQDLTSSERCLADSLVLLAEQQVAGEPLWLLPQARWQEGETLRQTAERALASLPGNLDFFVLPLQFLLNQGALKLHLLFNAAHGDLYE